MEFIETDIAGSDIDENYNKFFISNLANKDTIKISIDDTINRNIIFDSLKTSKLFINIIHCEPELDYENTDIYKRISKHVPDYKSFVDSLYKNRIIPIKYKYKCPKKTYVKISY